MSTDLPGFQSSFVLVKLATSSIIAKIIEPFPLIFHTEPTFIELCTNTDIIGCHGNKASGLVSMTIV